MLTLGNQRRSGPNDFLYRTGEELEHVDGVGADVAQRSPAGDLTVETPGERSIRSPPEVRQERSAQVGNRAELPLSQQLADVLDGRVVAILEIAIAAKSGLGHRRGNLRGFGSSPTERLLAADVLPGRRRRQRNFTMQSVRPGDVHDIHLRIVDHGAPVSARARVFPAASAGFGHGRNVIRHMHQDRLEIRLGPGFGDAAIGLAVLVAHPAGADKANTDAFSRHEFVLAPSVGRSSFRAP